LDGDPGIYSARWAENPTGSDKDFDYAMNKVRQAIETKGINPEGQNAYFACSLSLCWPDQQVETLKGTVNGSLTFPPRGEKGFGYDPIFVPINYQLTFGEMDQNEKHRISHRTDAFDKLVTLCFN
jgi:XTP/dITP diphosphohydrolase